MNWRNAEDWGAGWVTAKEQRGAGKVGERKVFSRGKQTPDEPPRYTSGLLAWSSPQKLPYKVRPSYDS